MHELGKIMILYSMTHFLKIFSEIPIQSQPTLYPKEIPKTTAQIKGAMPCLIFVRPTNLQSSTVEN